MGKMKRRNLMWATGFILYYIFVLLRTSNYWLNSDLAGVFLNAIVATREGRIIPYGFNYTSIVGFQSHLILMPLIYHITNNVLISYLIHNIILEILLMVSAHYLTRSMGISNRGKVLIFAFLAMPFSFGLVDMHVVSQFYSLQLLCIIVSFAIYFSIENCNKVHLIISVISLGVISFLQGLNGNRYLSFFYLPFICMIMLQIFIERKAFSFKKLLSLISCTIGSVLGYVVFIYYIKRNYSTYDFSMITENDFANPHSTFDALLDCIYTYFTFWGAQFLGKDLLSFYGIFMFVSLLLAVFFILILLCSYRNIRKEGGTCYYLLVFSLFSLLINNVLCIVLAETPSTLRYDYLPMYMLFICLIVYIDKCGFRNFINNHYVNFCFIILLLIYTVFCQYSAIKTPQLTDKIIGINDNNDYLIENDCNFAYASYWNANVSTVRSELKVEYAALSDSFLLNEGMFVPWFGGMPRDYYHNDYHAGTTAIILTDEENKSAANNLPNMDHIIDIYYNNHLYDINPFTFETELYQYDKLPSDN